MREAILPNSPPLSPPPPLSARDLHQRRQMEQYFQDGQHVRLRSRMLGTYLHADPDGHGVSLRRRRDSPHAAWTVHLLQGNQNVPYLLLHGAAHGRYLAATADPAPRGRRGHRVAQRDYDAPGPSAADIMWRTVGSSDGAGDDVVFRNAGRGCLRGNGRRNPLGWNNGVSVDDVFDSLREKMFMYWVVEPIPAARDGVPAVPRPTGIPIPRSLAVLLPGRHILYWQANADGLCADDWPAASFVFRGRSALHLRNELASRLGHSDFVMCIRAGSYGRRTPLVVDLPSSRRGGTIHIVVVMTGTPAAAQLRYPDVNAE